MDIDIDIDRYSRYRHDAHHTHRQSEVSRTSAQRTYYVTSSYILCHIIIHTMRATYILCHIIIRTMSHHHTYYVTSSYVLCHIIIHTMSHHHTYYVTSSYILCHIIIHTMSHHHTYSVTSSYVLDSFGATWQHVMTTNAGTHMSIVREHIL